MTPKANDIQKLAFLRAISRFIEAEYVHARAISQHCDRHEGATEVNDWSHSRDDVDLAHADLMNYPAITADLIAADLSDLISARAEIARLREAVEKSLLFFNDQKVKQVLRAALNPETTHGT